jgi:Fic family protein
VSGREREGLSRLKKDHFLRNPCGEWLPTRRIPRLISAYDAENSDTHLRARLYYWPDFEWDHAGLGRKLAAVRNRQGRLTWRMEELGFKLRSKADLEALTGEVMKSSEIEAEILDCDQVRSSIARPLCVDIGTLTPADSKVESVVETLLDATGNNRAPLGAERLFGWYAALFPAGRSGTTRITIGQWRTDATDPMQVICGRSALSAFTIKRPLPWRFPHK